MEENFSLCNIQQNFNSNWCVVMTNLLLIMITTYQFVNIKKLLPQQPVSSLASITASLITAVVYNIYTK